MLKLKHYFKKFWAPILLCVGLLFLQSQSELALPDYMSDIDSVGIQAGGFDSAVSDVLSEETYNHLLVLMDEEDQQQFMDAYKLVEPSNLDKDTLDKFPKAKFIIIEYKDGSFSYMRPELKNALKKENISVFDAEELAGHELENDKWRASDKEHPNGKAFSDIANGLIKQLKL